MEDESPEQVMSIDQAPREALIEIIQNLSAEVDALKQKGTIPGSSTSNYLEVELKAFGTFKMNSPTQNNFELFSNLLAFINGVKKTPVINVGPTALTDQMV